MAAQEPLKAFGARIAAGQDEVLRGLEGVVEAGRARLLAQAAAGAGPAPRDAREGGRPWVALGLAAAALAAGVGLLALAHDWRVEEPPAITFTVDGAPGAEAGVGRPIAAGAAPLAVRFSEGTALDLAAGARARVVEIDHRGARLSLERGELRARVVHRLETRWAVAAGPFDVRVTGTRFVVSWDPLAEELRLALEEGSVFVSGPLLGEGRSVVAGEVLRANLREARLEVAAPAEATGAGAGPAPGDVEAAAAGAGDGGADAERADTDAAGAGDLEDAYELLSAAALTTLGDEARIAGDRARASVAYRAIWRRFPGTPDAADAAFVLGRMALDEPRGATRASRWLERSLATAPDGAFAREAAGCAIEARLHAGDAAGARRAALRYLERFGTGPHAALARRVVAEGASE